MLANHQIELLSPAQRPVQVTRDLPGFWRGSYAAVRDDAAAQLSVLVSFQGTQYLVDPWGYRYPRPYYGSVSIGHGVPWGSGVGFGMGMRFPPTPQYRREVSLILRDLKSGQVVYETRASHDGPWSDSTTIFATLFKAALAHFPTPPAGPQRVNIEIPR